MNVNDFKSQPVNGDRLTAIFLKQTQLATKYHDIEKANGLLQTTDFPVDLNDPKGQARLKDFAWRVTEELGEAVDAALEKSWGSIHAREEVADALHFLVEMAILGGVSATDIAQHSVVPGFDTLGGLFQYSRDVAGSIPASINTTFTMLVKHLAMTCHTLKNKPWKTSHMLTDKDMFKQRMIGVFINFADFCLAIGMNADELTDLYFRKSQVNQFRQRSAY